MSKLSYEDKINIYNNKKERVIRYFKDKKIYVIDALKCIIKIN